MSVYVRQVWFISGCWGVLRYSGVYSAHRGQCKHCPPGYLLACSDTLWPSCLLTQWRQIRQLWIKKSCSLSHVHVEGNLSFNIRKKLPRKLLSEEVSFHTSKYIKRLAETCNWLALGAFLFLMWTCFMDSNIAASLFMLLSKKRWAHHSSIGAVCHHPLKWSRTAPKAKTELPPYSTGYPFLWPLCGNTRILFVLADHASPITLNGMSVHETRL